MAMACCFPRLARLHLATCAMFCILALGSVITKVEGRPLADLNIQGDSLAGLHRILEDEPAAAGETGESSGDPSQVDGNDSTTGNKRPNKEGGDHGSEGDNQSDGGEKQEEEKSGDDKAASLELGAKIAGSPDALEIVGRGDEEKPAEVPPEVSETPDVMKLKRKRKKSLEPTDGVEDSNLADGKENSEEKDVATPDVPRMASQDDATASRAEEGEDISPTKKTIKKKRKKVDAGLDSQPDALDFGQSESAAGVEAAGGGGAEVADGHGLVEKTGKGGKKKRKPSDLSSADGESTEAQDGVPIAERSADEVSLEDGEKASKRDESGTEESSPAGDEDEAPQPVRKKKRKTAPPEEGSSNVDTGEPGAANKLSKDDVNEGKDLPRTVEASEKEDSGNSGVAEEIALGSGGSGATTMETGNFDNKIQDSPVGVVGAPEQLAIEQAALDDEEDYVSFMSEVFNAGTRLSPAMQGLKDKTVQHVVPKVQEFARSSHAAFMKTSDKIRDHVTPILGPSFSPVVATLLSVSLLLLPLLLIGALVYHIRFILTLQRLLVLCNLYLCMYCFALLAACIIISGEPMRSLRQAAESNFLVLQIFVALGYLIYLGLQFWWLGVVSRAKGKEKDPVLIAKAALQSIVAVGVGLHYYIFVFERAMLDKAPKITAWGYLVYFTLFLLLTLIGRPKDDKIDVGKHT